MVGKKVQQDESRGGSQEAVLAAVCTSLSLHERRRERCVASLQFFFRGRFRRTGKCGALLTQLLEDARAVGKGAHVGQRLLRELPLEPGPSAAQPRLPPKFKAVFTDLRQ